MFLPHSDEICHRGTLQSFINFGHRKSLDERVGGGAECQSFPSKISCLTVPKKFVGEPFKVSLFSGIEKVHASDNYVIFSSKFFVSKNQKTLQGNPSVLCSRNIPVAKMFKVKRGSIKILRRKIFV